MLGLYQNGTNLNHIHTQSHSEDANKNSIQWGQTSRSTSLDLALTTYPCSSTFQVYTHLASITVSSGCYTSVKVPAYSRPWNSLFIECRHISACGDVSATKRSLECAGLMHARSADPERPRVRVRSCVSPHSSPTLTPGQHALMADHGDGRIPVMHRALHGSRHTSSRVSSRIPHAPVRG